MNFRGHILTTGTKLGSNVRSLVGGLNMRLILIDWICGTVEIDTKVV